MATKTPVNGVDIRGHRLNGMRPQRFEQMSLDLQHAKHKEPWMLDTRWFLNELARIRQLALAIPIAAAAVAPTNSVIDAVWHLESTIRNLAQVKPEEAVTAPQPVPQPTVVPNAGTQPVAVKRRGRPRKPRPWLGDDEPLVWTPQETDQQSTRAAARNR